VIQTEASPIQDLDIVGLNASPRTIEGVAHGQICSLLIERLEDVRFYLS
jgi:hypothetical protein